MPDRFELALKIACLLLAALVLYEFSRLVARWNPLARTTVPALPTLSGRTNVEAIGKATNPPLAQMPKQAQAASNAVTWQKPGKSETNAVTSQRPATLASNPAPAKVAEGSMPMPFPFPPPMMMMGMKAPELPPATQARVDRIAQSEILAPFIRPLPMALLGIAGDSAFLRAPTGQSGVIKVGGEVGGIKLVRIGTNRVLIEQDGQQKELTVFSGYGGESLLPTPTQPLKAETSREGAGPK